MGNGADFKANGGEMFNFDNNNGDGTATLSWMPDWSRGNGPNGEITGTSGTPVTRDYCFTFAANDNSGLDLPSREVTITITVNEIYDPMQITGQIGENTIWGPEDESASTIVEEDSEVSTAITVKAYPGATVYCEIDKSSLKKYHKAFSLCNPKLLTWHRYSGESYLHSSSIWFNA